MKETHFNATEGIVLLLKQQIELIESTGKKKKAQRNGKGRCGTQTKRASWSLNIHGPRNRKPLNAKYLHN